MPGPKKAQSVICHAVISSLMYGMLKHVLLSSLCKNNYLGVGIPVYTCLSKRACHFTHKFVSLPFLTHTTYIRFFFWPSSRHSSLSQQKRRRREKRERKGGKRKERKIRCASQFHHGCLFIHILVSLQTPGIPVYACLSERVSHFTHTFVSFSGQPFTEASHPAGSPVRVKRLRQSTQLPLHTRKRREFPFMPACQREIVTSHIQSFLSQPIRHQPSICFLEGGGYQIQSVRVNLEGRGRFSP